MTRKAFLRGMIVAGIAPNVVPSTVLGANAPSNRITVGDVEAIERWPSLG